MTSPGLSARDPWTGSSFTCSSAALRDCSIVQPSPARTIVAWSYSTESASTVTWQPMTFRSLVERPNAARPTLGPRPQYVTGGSVDVTVRVVDLVRDVELYDRPLSISLDLFIIAATIKTVLLHKGA